MLVGPSAIGEPVNSLRRCSLQSLGSLPAGAKFGLERATPICSAYRCHGLLCEGIPLLQRDCRCFWTLRHHDSKSLRIPFAVGCVRSEPGRKIAERRRGKAHRQQYRH